MVQVNTSPFQKKYIDPNPQPPMKSTYDDYYQSEALFGDPYPELMEFFAQYPNRGKLLDVGCGQGRDAIPLARLGYATTGIDCSEVGINQMLATGQTEGLNLTGIIGDMYAFDRFQDFEMILLNSLFHFNKKDRATETALIERILQSAQPQTVIVLCIQDQFKKVAILEETIEAFGPLNRLLEMKISYTFTDKQNNHSSTTPYLLLAVQLV